MKWNHAAMLVLVGISISISGCDDEDARVAQVAREAADRQARQNQEMSDLNREVAKAHQELIKEEASSRQDAMIVHRKIIEQQAELNRQSVAVDGERRELAKQRYWEPIWAELLADLATLAACVLPLVVCAYLLHRSPAPSAADEISEVLLDQLDPGTLKIGLQSLPSLEQAVAGEQQRLPSD